jgi:hypothetical protein
MPLKVPENSLLLGSYLWNYEQFRKEFSKHSSSLTKEQTILNTNAAYCHSVYKETYVAHTVI